MKLCQFSVIYLSMTLALGLPHRGAISVGNIDIIKIPLNGEIQTNAVGSGIVNAHNYETEQEWMGCVITPECEKELININFDKLSSDKGSPIVTYPTPYKDNAKYTSNYVINWTLFKAPLKNQKEFFLEQFGRHNKGHSESSITKVENTYKFFRKQQIHES